jgi:membrane fusion protein, heavy metal efflux system
MATPIDHDAPVRVHEPNRRLALGALVVLLITGCQTETPAPEAEAASWSVTAWGELYELFPEVDPLVAGTASPAHTHVTILDHFRPLEDGRVEIVLRGAATEQVFAATTPLRAGIYEINVEPSEPGEFELLFRIDATSGKEEIRGGVVRVASGSAATETLVRAPAPRGARDAGEPMAFLKEQQWRTTFATDWVRRGSLPESARGLARVRAPAGADVTLTANLDGVVQATPWPFLGQTVAAGAVLFRIAARVANDSSLAELNAVVAALEAEEKVARARLGRLEELLSQEATSRREVEEARAKTVTLKAQLEAAAQDLKAASAAREGRGMLEAFAVRAPFAGRVAAVAASPGAAVTAGDTLGRVLRSGPFWLEVDLQVAAAQALAAQLPRAVILEPRDAAPIHISAEKVRLVAIAPEVDPEKGTVAALLEVENKELFLGTTLPVEILFAEENPGIVVPATALIDDGGVAVVYLQLSGERFARQEVEVLRRQGERVLVAGLEPGQRLVMQGGEAIRRASLMSSGEAAGHVH